MIRAAVCDDDASIRKTLCAYLKRFAESRDIELDIQVFESGAMLLQDGYQALDLLIMDIQMPSISGLDTARAIRKTNGAMTIIFVTNFVQYALEGYEVQAFRFLLKPLDYPQFARVVGEAIGRIHAQSQAFLNIRAKNGMMRLPIDAISYIETEKGHVFIHTDQGAFSCFSPMRDMESALAGHNFFRCHSAYLVPMAKIQTVLRQDVSLCDGTLIPLSKHRKKALKEALAAFWGDKFL